MRASDADRERAADVLRAAAGEGRLTVEELDERLHTAYRTAEREELQALVADVMVEPGEFLPAPAPAGAPAPASASRDRTVVRAEPGGTDRVVAILGGGDRSGRWRLAPRLRVTNVLGGANLDLTEAELSADESEMRVFSFLGGADIMLPDHLNVEVSEVNVLGGNDVKLGDAHPDPGGPVLRLRLVSILGGTDVQRGRKPTLGERLAERRRRRELGGD